MRRNSPIQKWMQRVDEVLKILIGMDFLALFVLNVGQIISRSLIGISSVLIPDISRFLFIWLVFLGTASIYHHKQHLVIEFIKLKFPRNFQHRLSIGTHAFMMIFFVILIRFGWRIMVIRMDIPYTGWEIPTGYAYLAVPISAFLMLLFTLGELDHRMKNAKGFPV
jgi:TRAP-type C4-dicarboxylate transport system permease small subunit